MGVNVKFFLTWLICLDLRRKLFVKFHKSLSISAWFIGVTGLIKPLSAVESVIAEVFHKQHGGHIDFVQVHSKVYKYTCLEQKQPWLRVTLHAILINCIVSWLPCKVAFQLDCDDCKTIQINHNINAFLVVCIYAFNCPQK